MTDGYWDPVYELMLEEARRSIDRQSERLQTVRERSVGLSGSARWSLQHLDLVTWAKLGRPESSPSSRSSRWRRPRYSSCTRESFTLS